MVDEEKAARQSRVLANVIFGIAVVVIFACSMFTTWAWLFAQDTVPWPPIVLALAAITMWVVLVALLFRAWKQAQRRKQLGL
jgi:membrane protein YdbS with pleckstrin-like domain